jgi:hypothetical protein
MKNRIHFPSISTLFLLSVLFVALLATGCNPTGDNHDHHSEPFGLVLLQSGVELAKQQSGSITYSTGSSLSVPVGDETPLITLRFLDEDGDQFIPEDDEYSLMWAIGNESVLEVHTHDGDGKWAFHLEGAGAGSTTIRFLLMHDGHSDFESLPFSVTVQ